MACYPIALNIADKKCVVVGGGVIAQRKVAGLLEAGGKVVVISPLLTLGLRELLDLGQIEYVHSEYRQSMLADAYLVIAATNDNAVNEAVYRDAHAVGALVNVVDDRERCDFFAPAVVRRGDLSISVSTSGAYPALCKKIMQQLNKLYGPEYEKLTEVLAAIRPLIQQHGPEAAHAVLERVMESEVLELLSENHYAKAQQLAVELVEDYLKGLEN